MKFVKAAALLMSLSIVGMSLCACSAEPEPVSSDINIISSQSQNTNSKVPDGTADPNAESSNYVFVYNGFNFIVNAPMDESKLPDDDYDVFEVASCAGPGMAKQYTFKGGSFKVELFTDSDVIAAITICDDTVTTAEGIYIGNTVEQVKAAYGEPVTDTGAAMIYEKGSSELRIFVNDGVVNSIVYFAKY